MLARLPPVARAAGISCCSMALGDALCQGIRARGAGKDVRIDWRQTARFAAVGLTLHGPYFFHAFRWLDTAFGPAATLRRAALKTLVGQVTVFPAYLGSFFIYMGLLEGLSLQQSAQKLQQAFLPTFKVGWAFWPAANMVNFLVVPSTHRVAYANAAGLIWNAVLSWENATKGRVAAAAAADSSSGGGGKRKPA